MPALFLAILSSASLALIFRTTEARNHSRYVITAVNYFAAVVTAALLFLFQGSSNASVPTAPVGVVGEPISIDGIGALPLIAIPGGVLFFLSFILYQRSVAEYGPGPAGMYGKLGVLVPMVLSMVVWRELPTAFQWIGLTLAIFAIVVSQSRPGGDSPRYWIARPILLVLLLSMGFAEFSNKLFERFVDDRYRAGFLALLFGVALIGSIAAVVYRRERPTIAEIGWGILVGIPNLFSSFFLIASLNTVPAAVAFPAFSAGSIGVIVLGARVLYGDTLSRRQWVAVILTAGALILINL